MDTWDIPYQRKALPMPGSSVTAPLGQCRDNFDTEDASECVSVEHDTASGAVNVTLHCCVYNDKMFKKDTMIRANAYRCEILVCEDKVYYELLTNWCVIMTATSEKWCRRGDRVQTSCLYRGQADVRMLFKVRSTVSCLSLTNSL